jgi:hypothetical protein
MQSNGRQQQPIGAATLRKNENTIQRHSQMFSMNGARNDVKGNHYIRLMIRVVVGQGVSLSRVR